MRVAEHGSGLVDTREFDHADCLEENCGGFGLVCAGQVHISFLLAMTCPAL